MDVWGVVLAGGRGTRFGGRKQFETVNGRRLVDHVIDVMTPLCDGLVLVVPDPASWDGASVSAVTPGGATRSSSVRAALAAIPGTAEVVLVHDPAHPLAPRRLFTAVVDAVAVGADAAAPALPIEEPVKRVGEHDTVVETVPRAGAVLIQTPQAFRAAVLRAVHVGEPEAVEDTELVERNGGRVVVVPGDPANVHVTAPEHLELVERLAGPCWEWFDR